MSVAALVLAVALGHPPVAVQTPIPAGAPSGPSPAPRLIGPEAPSEPERLVEIVVHGNHTTTDADIAAAAGLTIGVPIGAETIAAATRRLETTGRFEGVEIRKRYRSLAAMDQVVLVILIDERPHPMDLPSPPVLRPFTTLRDGLMFLPLVSFSDGYGLSYGARFTFADVLGRRGRISVPLTWGAERRVAAEVERKFRTGPLSRVEGGAGLLRREHPLFEVSDRRGQVWLRGERALPGAIRIGGGWSWTDVSFGGPATPALDLDERMTTAGLDVALDTRTDPTFPRNAVHARAAWEHLSFDARPSRQRVTLDGRGYVGLVGSSVLGLRLQHGRADGPLPPYEQWLLGGPSSLRGFGTGSFAGDRFAAASLELRLPFSSPLRVAKTGVAVFVDRGAVWAFDQTLTARDWKQGYGAGVFAIATVFQFRLDVAHGQGRGTRAHVSAGLTF